MTESGCSVPRLLDLLAPASTAFYRAIAPACHVHDDAYERGGTELMRRVADLRLYADALELARSAPELATWTDDEIIASAHSTYQGVRIGGADPKHWRMDPPTVARVENPGLDVQAP